MLKTKHVIQDLRLLLIINHKVGVIATNISPVGYEIKMSEDAFAADDQQQIDNILDNHGWLFSSNEEQSEFVI